MPLILNEDFELFKRVCDRFGAIPISLRSLLITSIKTIFQRGKMDYMMTFPHVDTLMTDNFVKGFTHRASEMGATGLDIVEMLEFIRSEYEQVRTGTLR